MINHVGVLSMMYQSPRQCCRDTLPPPPKSHNTNIGYVVNEDCEETCFGGFKSKLRRVDLNFFFEKRSLG